jgi:hypothetical protein
VWRLRCSVFRGTHMALFCVYFQELNCYEIGNLSFRACLELTRACPYDGINGTRVTAHGS